jgi:release factor glutamine methyltransferase
MGSGADTIPLFARLAAARDQLIATGISRAEAAVDVDLYARTILGWDRARLLAEARTPVPAALEPQFSEWLARRSSREPSAYIVGVREFWGLDFHVTPSVLIPRPETEFIVEEALTLLRPFPSPRIADIGTGSGCIAVSLAHELPDSHVVASDISGEALRVARQNAERHGVADRIEFFSTAYLGGVDGDFDLIAANPPYVREGDKPALSADVRHEPDVALFGGASGLRDVEAVLDTAVVKLRRHGWLVMEFGFGQEEEVRALAGARATLRVERIRDDLQGIARTVIIQRA